LLLFVVAVAILSSLSHVSVITGCCIFVIIEQCNIMSIARTMLFAASCSKSGTTKGKMMKVHVEITYRWQNEQCPHPFFGEKKKKMSYIGVVNVFQSALIVICLIVRKYF